MHLGTWLAKKLGSSAGGIGYEIEGPSGYLLRYAIVSASNSFLTAVAPAVLAAWAIAKDRLPHRGLVLPERQVVPGELFAFLSEQGITITNLDLAHRATEMWLGATASSWGGLPAGTWPSSASREVARPIFVERTN